jgi:diguanylate cyclase (GGDEF)-like protein
MRYFQGALEAEIERCKRRHEPMSLLMMDLDKFKQYNDDYGHPIGDEALRRFGQMIREQLRPYDTLARYGGDEFIVLLPATNAAWARHVAERLHQYVAEAPVQLSEGITLHFSCSIGVATYPLHGRTPNELVRSADDALYAAKRTNGDVRAAAAEA